MLIFVVFQKKGIQSKKSRTIRGNEISGHLTHKKVAHPQKNKRSPCERFWTYEKYEIQVASKSPKDVSLEYLGRVMGTATRRMAIFTKLR